jgi:Hsp70 protein
MAMVLVKAKEVAVNANGNVGIADAVIAVPHWFTDAQRKGKIGSCTVFCCRYINVLSLCHCHSAWFPILLCIDGIFWFYKAVLKWTV